MIPYALTIFLSAFLLFQVQPLIAKIILPWFGGAASVWTTCMLFFQMLLLGGYLYSHWIVKRFSPQKQARIHLILLGLSILTLPILPGSGWKPPSPDHPALRILALLSATVGLPYLLLSTTGPLIQAWFTRDSRNQGKSPYRLYALSNTGSMLALLTYPFVIEPVISSRVQSYAWSAAYVVFVLLGGITAWRSTQAQGIANSQAPATPAPTALRMAVWTALACCGSSFLLTVTNHLSQNIASIPFLWIVPLSIYLLSFILTFDTRAYQRKFFLYLFAVAMGTMAYAMSAESGNLPVQVGVPIFGIGLFVACMVCHGELVRLKPDPQHLTSFYVATALGGALGGIFVGVVAPNVFPGYFELPITIAAASTLILLILRRDESLPLLNSGLSFEFLLLVVMTLGMNLYLFSTIGQSFGRARLAVRNFYGGLRVDQEEDGDEGLKRKLTHGTINHGEQYLDSGKRSLPVTYYGFDSGIGRTLLHIIRLQPLRVGVIGLGTGTLATYGKAGDHYTFYEINPKVEEIARKQFFYISESKAKVDVVLGDARLSLEREPPQGFDVLALDAFSSDSIPVHLLTREAFQLYFRHLKPDGILAVHVSNRYLDLKPVVFRLAQELNKEVRVIDTEDDPSDRAIFGATWMLVTADRGFFERPAIKSVGHVFTPERTPPVWTDDYSNLFSILK